MSDERRKDPVMRQRIDELQSGLTKQAADLKKDRARLTELSAKLTRLMWTGIAAIIIAAGALTYLGFKLDDRGDAQGRLARENAALVKQLDGLVKKTQAQREKSAENACLTRREQNATLIRAFVPPSIQAQISKKDRDILMGPDDCKAYGKSVTTDQVPPPKRGTTKERR